MKHLLTIIIITALAYAYAGCVSSGRIDSRSELARPGTTGSIRVITASGAKYEFSEYRCNDTTLFGVGRRNDVTPPESFTGELPLRSISYIHSASPNRLKTFMGIAGIIAFSAILNSHMRNSTNSVEGVVAYHYPGGGHSCPFLYSFDGSEYRLESETYAGAIIRNAERRSYDVLSRLAEIDGKCRVRLTNELPETHYTDQLVLKTVDAPAGVGVVADKFGRMHTIGERILPVCAVDLSGRDVRRSILACDSASWRSTIAGIDFTHECEYTDGIIVEFPKPKRTSCVKLLVKGKNTFLSSFAVEKLFALKGAGALDWYRTLESTPSEAEKLLGFMRREAMLRMYVWEHDGWVLRDTLLDVGPMVEKEQTALLDCRYAAGDKLRIKIESSTDLWIINSVCADSSPDLPVRTRVCPMLSAINEEGKDVAPALISDDGKYYSTISGQWADISFTVSDKPLPTEGRHYVIEAKGYYHPWFTNVGEDHAGLVERILTERSYGARLLMPEWKSSTAAHD